MQLELPWNSWSSCFHFLCAGIIGVYRHITDRMNFLGFTMKPLVSRGGGLQCSASSSAELSFPGQSCGSNGCSTQPRRCDVGMGPVCSLRFLTKGLQQPTDSNNTIGRELERGHLFNRLQSPPRKAGHTLLWLDIVRLLPKYCIPNQASFGY